MPGIGNHVAYHPDGSRYELTLSLDDAAIMDNALSIRVDVIKCGPDTQEGPSEDCGERYRAKAEILPFERQAIVDLGAGWQFTIDLDDMSLADHEYRAIEELEENGLYWRELAEKAMDPSHPIEELIQFVPAGDPFLGCLIKGGLSTAVGQAIECHQIVNRDLDELDEESERKEAEELRVPRRRMRRMFRCLRENGVRMLWRTAVRTARCTFTLGFG